MKGTLFPSFNKSVAVQHMSCLLSVVTTHFFAYRSHSCLCKCVTVVCVMCLYTYLGRYHAAPDPLAIESESVRNVVMTALVIQHAQPDMT